MQQPSIFTKIINGDIPCHKIYEDEKTLAFLDINPNTAGHTLVIPKTQVDKLYALPADDYAAVMESVKKVANRLQAVLQPTRVGILVQGFDVPHAHVHLIPISSPVELDHDHKIERPTDDQLRATADKLCFA